MLGDPMNLIQFALAEGWSDVDPTGARLATPGSSGGANRAQTVPPEPSRAGLDAAEAPMTPNRTAVQRCSARAR